MMLKVFFCFLFFAIFNQVSTKTNSISLNCDIRPFNDLHLLNYFLKQQLKKSPIPSEDLTRKFYDFRDTVNLGQLEADCDKKSKAKFALIKQRGKNEKYESNTDKRSQKNRKEISQRMSLELGELVKKVKNVHWTVYLL